MPRFGFGLGCGQRPGMGLPQKSLPGEDIFCKMTGCNLVYGSGKVSVTNIVMAAACTGNILIRDIADNGGALLLTLPFTFTSGTTATSQTTWSNGGEPVDVFYTSDTSVAGYKDVTAETLIASNRSFSGSVNDHVVPQNPV